MKCKHLLSAFAVAVALMAAPASADLSSFSEDFEGLNGADGAALSGAGWLVFGNVYNDSGVFQYGYGPFGAPNGGAGFSAVAGGDGGPNQGSQYINVYSDYNNGDHNQLNWTIEANVFQEQTIGAADLGETFDFGFDFRHNPAPGAGPGGTANTLAFIKVLDPNAGFATVAFEQFDTTANPTMDWVEGNQLSVTIDNAWDGNILQFGFLAASGNFDPTGVFYDNLTFQNSAIPEPGSAALLGLGLGLVAMRRRR